MTERVEIREKPSVAIVKFLKTLQELQKEGKTLDENQLNIRSSTNFVTITGRVTPLVVEEKTVIVDTTPAPAVETIETQETKPDPQKKRRGRPKKAATGE